MNALEIVTKNRHSEEDTYRNEAIYPSTLASSIQIHSVNERER